MFKYSQKHKLNQCSENKLSTIGKIIKTEEYKLENIVILITKPYINHNGSIINSR